MGLFRYYFVSCEILPKDPAPASHESCLKTEWRKAEIPKGWWEIRAQIQWRLGAC